MTKERFASNFMIKFVAKIWFKAIWNRRCTHIYANKLRMHLSEVIVIAIARAS
mgnify:CR=1 FL=1